MRRLERVDRLLLLLLVPWALVMALHVDAIRRGGLREPAVMVESAGSGPPSVTSYRLDLDRGQAGLQLGDRILRIGSRDARGLGPFTFLAASVAEADGATEVPVEIERAGERQVVGVRLVGPEVPWARIPSAIVFLLTALVVLLRAPEPGLARRFFLAVATMGIFTSPFPAAPYPQALAHHLVFNLTGGLALALNLAFLLRFPGELLPRERLPDALAWGIGLAWYVPRLLTLGGPLPPTWVPPLGAAVDVVAVVALAAVPMRNALRCGPVGRRRMRWLLLGFAVGLAPLVVGSLGALFAPPESAWVRLSLSLGGLTMVAIPLAFLAAIVQHNLFDIDRLLSQAATAGISIAVLVAALLVVMPGLAAALSGATGADALAARVGVSVALALAVTAGAWRLRPWLDRALFPERAAREAALRAEKEAAQSESVEKTRFLASASHDLRQPVHALGLLVGALGERRLPEDLVPLVERIESASRSVEEMLNGVLDLSRLDAGLVQATPTAVALGPLLHQLAEEIRPEAERRGVALRVVGTSTWIRTDPLQLRRVVQNGLTNAVRYTRQGRVLVGCRRRDARVRIEIHDTGVGIPRPQIEEAFRPYRRLEPEGGLERGGLGLGLAIAARLAALLGHELDLRSEPGRGTRYAITVERAQPRAEPEAAAAEHPLHGTAVLVIDDDAAVRDGMAELLRPWGCAVALASDVAEASRAVETSSPDVILSDYWLGAGSSGLEAIAAVRRAAGREVPALLISGDVTVTSHATGLLVLRKPVSPLRLRAALAQALGRSATTPTSSA